MYIGNQTAARSREILHFHGITRIVNCTKDMRNAFEDLRKKYESSLEGTKAAEASVCGGGDADRSERAEEDEKKKGKDIGYYRFVIYRYLSGSSFNILSRRLESFLARGIGTIS